MKLNPRTYLQVIAIIFVLAITSISILFYHAYEEAFSLLKDQFNEEQMLIAKQTAAGIEKNILLLARELETLSRVPAIRELDLGEAESAFKATFAYIRTFGANDIGLIDSKGILLLPLMAPHIKDADFSFRAYFKETRTLEKSTPVFEFIDFKGVDIGKKGIIIAVPIFDSNTAFKGVVVFTIRIAELLKDFALPK
ncbi:MAG: hypothetical protein GY852_02915, partial [bacterium]|nr:hypothetical protein [bacterium]